MQYVFSVRPVLRAVVLLAAIGIGADFLYVAAHATTDIDKRIVLIVLGLVLIFCAYRVLGGLWRLLRAYGRTWWG